MVYKDLYGQYMSKVELVNGKFDGKWNRWSKSGQMMSEWNYKNGKKDGKWTSWYENGQIKNQVTYKDGECISRDCPT